MAWYEFLVGFHAEKKEIVNAFLISIGADAILDNEDHFICYKNNPDNLEEFCEQIRDLPGVKGNIDYNLCEEKNWNADWESNYEPISISDICSIRAEFHPKNLLAQNEIIIRPQMAFGTGHHATTYMMIEMMNQIELFGKEVLDYGCGTGILAVFAGLQKAKCVTGVDIEVPAIENSTLHRELNNLDPNSIKFLLGGLDVIANEKFEVILANINRKVLLQTKDGIKQALHPNGLLIMSGILEEDESLLVNHYSSDFHLIEKKKKEDWLCFLWRAKN